MSRLSRIKARILGDINVKPEVGQAVHFGLGYAAGARPEASAAITMAFLFYQWLNYKAGEDPRTTAGDVLVFTAGLLAGLGIRLPGLGG